MVAAEETPPAHRPAKKPMIFQDLYPDLIKSILSRVPLKPRSRLKCVSKLWHQYIAQLPRPLPPPTASGLLAFRRFPAPASDDYETTFLRVSNHGGACDLHSSVKQSFPWLLDTCSGLVLFSGEDPVAEGFAAYYVYNHADGQWLALPRGHKISRTASAALFLDSRCSCFKVICNFWEEVDAGSGVISYQIFSSEDWEWRENRSKVRNSYLLLNPSFCRGQCFLPSVSHNGRLYWIWSLFLLVYDGGEESFELVQLPKKSPRPSNFLGSRLWLSEETLHYCDSGREGLFIWTYSDNDDKGRSRSEEGWMWRLRHCVKFSELKAQNEGMFQMAESALEQKDELVGQVRWGPNTIWPCAFNEDLQILYLRLPDVILSYSFESKKLMKAWTYPSVCKVDVSSFEFCSVNFPHLCGRKCRFNT